MTTTSVTTGYLSAEQERLWRMQNGAALSPYVCGLAWIVRGLDPQTASAAINQVVSRHGVLRTIFSSGKNGGSPMQVVVSEASIGVGQHDWRSLPHSEHNAMVRDLLGRMTRFEGVVSETPQFRAEVCRLAGQSCVIALAVPAILSDRAGLRSVAAEIVALGCRDSAHLELDPLQYVEIAKLQRSMSGSPEALTARSYWRRHHVGGVQPATPGAKASSHDRYRCGILHSVIPREKWLAARDVAQRAAVGPDALLLCCWQLVLKKLTDRESVIVGVSAGGRLYDELRGVPGLLESHVPIESKFTKTHSAGDALRDTALQLADVMEWASCFEWRFVREAAEPDGPPLHFQFGFEFESHVPDNPQVLECCEFAFTDRFDVKLRCSESENGATIEWQYDATCFNKEYVQLLARRFEACLSSLCARLDEATGDVCVLDSEERSQVVEEFNALSADYGPFRCINKLIESKVAGAPDAPAVLMGTACVTRAELDRSATQIARRLCVMGIGPEIRVGVFLDRHPAMIASVLAILKAGGAYVPLDPSWPPSRLDYVLRDAEVRVILTDSGLRSRLPSGVPPEVLLMGAESHDLDLETPEAVNVDVHAANLAYVIYTSGSTGQPKGVLATHANLWQSTLAREACYPEAPLRFLLLSSLAFDSSIAGLFGTLARGGTLVLPANDPRSHLRDLPAEIDRCGVTHTLCLPSLYDEILHCAAPGQLRSLRGVIVAGEECPVDLVRRHRQVLPGVALFNEYGPTECSVWSTVSRLDTMEDATETSIGRPIPLARVYILDEREQLQPLGVSGEIHIGGPGVTRGYLHHAALTADKFRPDPWSPEGGARMYRTGDLARLDRSGAIAFLGRTDNQVKIRGYRIELGEIESALLNCPRVSRAAVVLREDRPGDKRLVAYVVERRGVQSGDLQSELIQQLRDRLPGHMLPSNFVFLQALPLNSNGKLDRSKLPQPDRAATRASYTPPNTRLERRIAACWSEILGVDRVGVNDNFFEAGGHSLLAVRLMEKLIRDLERDIRLIDLFQYPTVAAFARFLSDQGTDTESEKKAEDAASRRRLGLEARRRASLSAR